MDEALTVYVDRLMDDQVEEIQCTFSSDFLEIREKELRYEGDVAVTGEVYIASDMLIVHLNIQVVALVPCTVCNRLTETEVAVQGHYHTLAVSEVRKGTYDVFPIVREVIVLETPPFTECEGSCPRRKDIEKYLKKENAKTAQKGDEDGYHPFADLKLD